MATPWSRPVDFEELSEQKAEEIRESRRDEGEDDPTPEEMFLSGALWAALMAEGKL